MRNFFLKVLVFYLVATIIFPPVLEAKQGNSALESNNNIMTGTQQPSVGSFGNPNTNSNRQQSYRNDNLGNVTPNLSANTSSIVYSVHILGEVSNPGTYKITPSDRVTDAIRYAGGILLNGSERSIELRRQGSKKYLDLFAYKYRGTLGQNPYLTENDVIFVPVKKGAIELEGPVNRPGVYEITKSISLSEALRLAGGFAGGLSKQDPIKVVRFNSSEEKVLLDVKNETVELDRFKVQKGDVIVIPHILLKDNQFDYNLNRIPGDNIFYPTVDSNVYVMGAILQPGAYPFQPNFTYKEYVSLAGASQFSKLNSIKIIRRSGERLMAKHSSVINPGDTIVVPQRYWRPETVASWLSTVASLTLSTILIQDKLSN